MGLGILFWLLCYFWGGYSGLRPSIGTLPMPAARETARPFADKCRVQSLTAALILCGLLWSALAAWSKDPSVQEAGGDKLRKEGAPANQTGAANTQATNGDGHAGKPGGDSQILSFPASYSEGSLYRLKLGHGSRNYYQLTDTFFAQARGNVVVPRGVLLCLTVSYQGGEDLTFLDRLPPGVVAFLKMERLSITDQQFKALKSVSDLKGLELTDVDITDRGIMHLQNCHDLAYAALKSMVITGKGLAALRNLHTLKHLDCEQDMFDDASMSNLSGLTNLKYLRLKNVRITDAGLKHLLPLTEVEELILSINKITDSGVAILLPLKKLRKLDLTDTKVTMACLDSLAKFPNLCELTISQLDFTPAQLEEFRRKLPHCRISNGKKIGADMRVFDPLH
jgi:hypothetical protein